MTSANQTIRDLRLGLGRSQADLARAVGVHPRQIRRYETGEQQPAMPVALRLAEALGVSVEQLAGQPAPPDRASADRGGHLVPLTGAMRRAMAEREESFRSLAKLTAKNGVRGGRGLTSGYLGAVARGDDRPSLEAIEAIAEALEADPETIAEYRLAVARRLFDEHPPPVGVGYDEALANLERFGLLGPVSDPGEDGTGGRREPPRGGRPPRPGS